MLLIGDLCDAFNGQWHTFDIVKQPELLMQSHTTCNPFHPNIAPLSMITCSNAHITWVLVPDLSNSLQKRLLVDSRCRDAFIEKGIVHMELSFEAWTANLGGR